MPIPLVIGVVAGVAGAAKTGKALYDNKKAEEANDTARSISWRAEKELEESRENCEKALQDLGSKKAEALEKYIKNFINSYEKIKDIKFQNNGDFGNLTVDEFSEVVLKELKQEVSFVIDSGLGLGGGTVAGALTAFGAYNGTMAFAAAGTGTAISTLNGIAATNATLAWLGGGTLASGGMGVAGGTMALGALAAGPGLLIAGWYVGSKAETKLNNAHSNIAQAREFAADIDKAVALIDGITEVAERATIIISSLFKHSRRSVKKLNKIIEEQGVDFSTYDKEAKEALLRSVKITQVLKAAIDTPVLDEEGRINGSAEAKLSKIKNIANDGFNKIEGV